MISINDTDIDSKTIQYNKNTNFFQPRTRIR
jgi:hypothetical protein